MFRDCFYLNCKSGVISDLDQLKFVMRSVGFSPTLDELERYLKQKSKCFGWTLSKVEHSNSTDCLSHCRIINHCFLYLSLFPLVCQLAKPTHPSRQLYITKSQLDAQLHTYSPILIIANLKRQQINKSAYNLMPKIEILSPTRQFNQIRRLSRLCSRPHAYRKGAWRDTEGIRSVAIH